MTERPLVALAGQPNSGKSTIFNLLTGARQFVANYPGVTVEKKVGYYSYGFRKIELVDLPGTYSLASYSMEERVAGEFLLSNNPAAVINVVDASNLRKSLYLTLQLLEMGLPLVLDLNMMDVVERRGQTIDSRKLADLLGVQVSSTDGKRGTGGDGLMNMVDSVVDDNPIGARQTYKIDYGSLEPHLFTLESTIAQSGLALESRPARWWAVKLLENDQMAMNVFGGGAEEAKEIIALAGAKRRNFSEADGQSAEHYIAGRRHAAAGELTGEVSAAAASRKPSLTDRMDAVLCHRIAGPIILCAVFYLLYELAVNQGGILAALMSPRLSGLQSWLVSFLPAGGFLEDPPITSLASWFMTSMNALLVYIPQFFILFALVAILEDVGYMPRMAFILDRLFRRFGLHGNSTLPLVLGGIYVGGCAVPGVMACKAIPDDRSRMATILTVPLMNCLAKTVFYLMLIDAFFPEQKAWAMFFISSITLIFALPIARLLTMTILKNRHTAPFIMEMPSYHLPTIRGVLTRALERIWVYVRKVVTIVAAVAVVIWALLQFPGVPAEKMAGYHDQAERAMAAFLSKAGQSPLGRDLKTQADIVAIFDFREAYRAAKAKAVGDRQLSKQVDDEFSEQNPVFASIVKNRKEPLHRALEVLRKERNRLKREINNERINHSLLGKTGKFLEPITSLAGFDWRINVALLSSFAARESATATMKALYGIGPDGKLKSGFEGSTSIDQLNALALMIFMVLFPPCLATSIMVKVATGGYKWMFVSLAYPAFLGVLLASLVYTGGKALSLNGSQAMLAVYGLALACALGMGLLGDPTNNDN